MFSSSYEISSILYLAIPLLEPRGIQIPLRILMAYSERKPISRAKSDQYDSNQHFLRNFFLNQRVFAPRATRPIRKH